MRVTAAKMRRRRSAGSSDSQSGSSVGMLPSARIGGTAQCIWASSSSVRVGDLAADGGDVVGGLDLEVRLQHGGDGRVGRGLRVGDGRRLQQQPALRAVRAGELPHQARLADAGFADDPDALPVAGAGAIEETVEVAQLLLAAEEPGEGARRRLQTRGGRGAEQLEDLDRQLEALDGHRPVRGDLDVAVGQAARRLADERGAGTGELLHARGQVGRLPDRRVLDVEVAADRAHDHVAGVDAHADLHVDALAPAQVVGVHGDRAVHAQRGVAGAHGVVLVGDGRPEQGHDAVTHHLVDGALEAVDGLHEPLDHVVEQRPGVLGIAVGHELQRALEVGEQDGDLLALAGQGGARGEDLASEVAGRVGVGGGKARVAVGHAPQRDAALVAELVPGRVGGAAGGAARLQPRAALTAELRAGGVVVVAPRALHSAVLRPGVSGVEQVATA